MDSQGLRQEFVYNGTPQEFANYLWALEQNQWGKFTDEKLAWQQLAPQPIIRSHAGRPPYQVDYMGTSKVPFIDPADGQEREATEPVPGITLELEPLANGQTRVVAQCHNRAFEGWYFHLLGLFGVALEATPTNEQEPTDGVGVLDQDATRMLDANRWAIEQVLDKGKRQRDILDEWLEMRFEEGVSDPVNPRQSLSKVIVAERTRRNGEV